MVTSPVQLTPAVAIGLAVMAMIIVAVFACWIEVIRREGRW